MPSMMVWYWNGEVENRRGRKIHPGDTISYDGKDIYVIG